MSDPVAGRSLCSVGARDRADAPAGTAPPATRWLLVEQDSGWGRDAQRSVEAPKEALVRLDRSLAAASARLELIRRPGRAVDPIPPPVAAVAGASFERATTLAAAEESPMGTRRWCVVDARLGVEVWGVRDADGGWGGALEALADPLAAGALRAEGVLLVCAHGKHDTCCALRGRPVAAALAEEWPQETWECSHLGGDRFAANLAVMPDGALYGYLDADVAVDVVRAHRRRTPDITRLRGVVGRASHEQAALIAAAPLLDVTPWDRRLTVTREATGRKWQVVVRKAKLRVRVTGHDIVTEPVQLTCIANHPRSALVPIVDTVTPVSRTPR